MMMMMISMAERQKVLSVVDEFSKRFRESRKATLYTMHFDCFVIHVF